MKTPESPRTSALRAAVLRDVLERGPLRTEDVLPAETSRDRVADALGALRRRGLLRSVRDPADRRRRAWEAGPGTGSRIGRGTAPAR